MSSLQEFLFLLLCFSYSTSLRENNEINKASASSFVAYWNVPSRLCKRYNIRFEKSLQRFDIQFNADEKFRGEKINILYNPGEFPVVIKNKKNYEIVNGGIPQSGDINQHIKAFRKTVDELVPKNFSGVGVIDFEDWRPIFRQNWKAQVIYKNLSIHLEAKNNFHFDSNKISEHATEEFEKAARTFMEETLIKVTKLRPQGTWGYYGFPYCYNLKLRNKNQCPDIAKQENDRIQWLFDRSTALHPSLYLTRQMSMEDIKGLINGRLCEARRVWKNGHKDEDPLVLPYITYKHTQTGGLLSKEEMRTVLKTVRNYDMGGVIIWGSSEDLRTKKKCRSLLLYLKKVLGPVLQNIRKSIKT